MRLNEGEMHGDRNPLRRGWPWLPRAGPGWRREVRHLPLKNDREGGRSDQLIRKATLHIIAKELRRKLMEIIVLIALFIPLLDILILIVLTELEMVITE